MVDLFDNNGALFSEDRKYRYYLWRIFDGTKPLVMYIGLNPSTAKEDKNDNTITKLSKITKFNGYGGFYMMNLFAIVSPYPEILKTDSDPLGDCDKWFENIIPKCKEIVFAWGNFEEAKERAEIMKKRFDNPKCLFKNKNGSPKHPLYCKDNTLFIPY